MKKTIPLLVILFIATLQFFLILRHKSVYTSDSYFYKHMMLTILGSSFDTAYSEVTNEVPLEGADSITKNIFTNKAQYRASLNFFVKRPLYPVLTAALFFITSREMFSFLAPVFVAYLGCIILIYCLAGLRLKPEYQTLVTLLFVSFYPFLDWSTYIMTDTIGFLFWLMLLYCGFQLVHAPNNQRKFLYILLLIFSLLNREQTLVMPVTFLVFYWLLNAAKIKGTFSKSIRWIVTIHFIFLILYVVTINVAKLPSMLDTLRYTQNSYGLENHSYTLGETIGYVIRSVVATHSHAAMDILRNRGWLVVTGLGILYLLVSIKNRFHSAQMIDMLMIGSMVASYLSVFLYPVLSYRYFYPVVFGLIYFASLQLQEFFAGDLK